MDKETANLDLYLTAMSQSAAEASAQLAGMAKAAAGAGKEAANLDLYMHNVSRGAAEASSAVTGLARSAAGAGKEYARLAAELKNGRYLAVAREAAVAQRALAALQKEMRFQDLVASQGKLSAGFTLMSERLQGVGRAGTWGLGLLTGSLAGVVRAGASGTTEMELFNRSLSRINYEVASVFTPWINRAVDSIGRLADYFQQLTGSQQANIREWVAGAAALSGMLVLLPRLATGLAAISRARTGAALLPTAAQAAAVAGGGVPVAQVASRFGIPGTSLLTGAGGSLLALLAASPEGRHALGELAKATTPLLTAFSRLAPAVEKLSKVIGSVIGWIIAHTPGLGNESIASNLAGIAGGALGYRFGGAPGAAVGFVAGKAVGTGAEESLAVGQQIAASGAKGALQSMESAQRQLEKLKADLAAEKGEDFGSEARRSKLRGYIGDLEASIKAAGGKAKDALTPGAAGFEGVQDLYRRIASTGSMDAQQATADNTEKMKEYMRDLVDTLRALGFKVPINRPGDS